jgi:hypothetical protein
MQPSSDVSATFERLFEKHLREGASQSTHEGRDALNLYEAGERVTAEWLERAAKQKAGLLNAARSYRSHGVRVTVDETSTQRELVDFLSAVIADVAQASRRIRLDREGLICASRNPRATTGRPHAAPRAPRTPRVRRVRLAASADDGPEPPPATCAGCPEPLPPGRSDKKFHSEACKQRAYRARRSTRSDVLIARADAVCRLIASRQLDPADGVLWVLFPEEQRQRYFDRHLREVVLA